MTVTWMRVHTPFTSVSERGAVTLRVTPSATAPFATPGPTPTTARAAASTRPATEDRCLVMGAVSHRADAHVGGMGRIRRLVR